MILCRAGVYLILISLAAIRVDSFLRSLYQKQRVSLTNYHPAAAAVASMIRSSPWPKLICIGSHCRLFSAVTVGSEGADDIKQHVLSVAPMMEYTDRHQRFLQRCLSKRSVLYTEMITSNALVRSDDKMRFLQADLETEHPLVLQFGGSDPTQMREAARIAFDYGYKEMNLNVGCPSDRVAGAGCFGAALMLNPQLVCELALSISEVTNRPATVKCRIGVNDKDSYEELREFIRVVSERGHVRHFVIHARKAILNANFSPHDNRTIPPLNYGFVYRLVDDFPNLHFTLNGGIGSIDHALQILGEKSSLAGVMVGRAVVNDPFHWSKVDSKMYGDRDPGLSRREILHLYAIHARRTELVEGSRARRFLVKPILNLFHGEPRGKLFRTTIDGLLKIDGGLLVADVILKAADCLTDAVLDATSYPVSYQRTSEKVAL